MKKYLFILICLIAIVSSCNKGPQDDQEMLLSTSNVAYGSLVTNVVVTTLDTTWYLEPAYDINKWYISLRWSGSTASVSSPTTVILKEGIDKSGMTYYLTTDTLTIDTAAGTKYWKATDFCAKYLAVNIGTTSGTTTTYNIRYLIKK